MKINNLQFLKISALLVDFGCTICYTIRVMENTLTVRETRVKEQPERERSKTRVYFFADKSAGWMYDLEPKDRVRNYRKLLGQVESAIREACPNAGELKFSWSWNAGCRCGCSPGFIVDGLRGVNVFVDLA